MQNPTFSLELALLAAIVLLQIADAVTTIIAARYPRFRESNGMMAALIRKVGILPAFLITKGIAIAVLLAMWHYDALLLIVLVPVFAVYLYTVYNNVQVIRRLRVLAAQDAARAVGG